MTEKYLQALEALKVANELDSNSPELHYRVIEFKNTGGSLLIAGPMLRWLLIVRQSICRSSLPTARVPSTRFWPC